MVRVALDVQAAFTASLYAGSLGGVSMGVLLVILASLPLCCGVMKEHSKATWATWERDAWVGSLFLVLVDVALRGLGVHGGLDVFMKAQQVFSWLRRDKK